jgi:hypothetical protein
MNKYFISKMEQQQPDCVLLLYSKYSENSTRFLELLKARPINFLRALCIDNEKIRRRILSSKNINVNCVPCILIYFPTGVVEKYDGENAFSWAQNIIQKMYPPPPPPPPRPPQQSRTPLERQPPKQQKPPPPQPVEPEPEPEVQAPRRIPPPRDPVRTENFEVDEEMFQKPQIPPPGTFREEGPTDSGKPVRSTIDGKPKSTQNKDILTKAAEMQKSREQSVAETNKKHPKMLAQEAAAKLN